MRTLIANMYDRTVWKFSWLSVSGLVAIFFISACASTKPGAVHPSASKKLLKTKLEIKSDLQTLRNVAGQLDNTRIEFLALHRQGGWQKRGYFDAVEHNKIERYYFRFVVGHTTLWDIINSYEGEKVGFADEETGIKAHALVLYAEFLLAFHTSFIVAEFMDDPVAIDKLNESFYRSDIPQGTYDRLHRNVTSKDTANKLAAAWILYTEDIADPRSMLGELVAADPKYKDLLGQLPHLHSGTVKQTQRILDAQTQNYLSHTRSAELAREARQEFGDLRFATRALLFKDISRLKNPSSHLIRFSAAQKRQIFDLLQPGDVILTYTAGYISDVFIPGMFKHGITVGGSVSQRKDAGLRSDSLMRAAKPEQKRFALNISQEYLSGGEQADIIEAVAEGVIFNNLEKIMDTHVNRLLVLRPMLSNTEKTEFLAGVFSFLGDEYDFYFDFADASRQVCTEAVSYTHLRAHET